MDRTTKDQDRDLIDLGVASTLTQGTASMGEPDGNQKRQNGIGLDD